MKDIKSIMATTAEVKNFFESLLEKYELELHKALRVSAK